MSNHHHPFPERLTLDEVPLAANAFKPGNYQRGIQVNWLDGSMDELVAAIKDATNVQVTLGKKPAIFLDDAVRPIRPVCQERGYIYARRPGEKRARLNGVMSIRDAASMTKAKELEDADMDAAVLSLQQSLAEHAQKKQANTTVLLKDTLPGANKRKPHKNLANSASSRLKPHRQGLFDQSNVNRSIPSSPSLMGMTPVPSSKPTAHQLRQSALKTSLIHLLAVRAVSESYIAKTLNCEASDLSILLEKYGRPGRLDPRKFDLSDRGFKELDVWAFGYKDSSDCQAAIDRAIAAYDRQRISTREAVWQMLLPKEERNKGKTLSKLKLKTGPPEQAKTPQIQVHSSTDGRPNGKQSPDGERAGRLAPGSAAGSRSDSRDALSRSKPSEKTAQAKRLLGKTKKPYAPTAETSHKPTHRSTPSIELKSAPIKTTTTTDATAAASKTVKSAKPATSKPTVSNAKYKSAEFVGSSDDDSEVEDTPITLAKPAVKTAGKTVPRHKEPAKTATKGSSQSNGTASKPVVSVPKKLPSKPAPSASANPTTKSSETDAARAPAGKSPLAHSRNRTLSSPHKPSRLGSSPPTNASDFENDGAPRSKSSSSSNSPLIHSATRSKPAPPQQTATRLAPASSSSSSERPLKRKADAVSEHVPSSSMRERDRERERERDRERDRSRDVVRRERERERDHRGREPQRGSSTQPPPAKRRVTASPSQRPQQHGGLPSTSSTGNGNGNASGRETGRDRSNTPSDAAATPLSSSQRTPRSNAAPSLSSTDLQSARRFKEMQLRYAMQLKELRAATNPQPDRVEKLRRMYSKLSEHKRSLAKLVAT